MQRTEAWLSPHSLDPDLIQLARTEEHPEAEQVNHDESRLESAVGCDTSSGAAGDSPVRARYFGSGGWPPVENVSWTRTRKQASSMPDRDRKTGK